MQKGTKLVFTGGCLAASLPTWPGPAAAVYNAPRPARAAVTVKSFTTAAQVGQYQKQGIGTYIVALGDRNNSKHLWSTFVSSMRQEEIGYRESIYGGFVHSAAGRPAG